MSLTRNFTIVGSATLASRLTGFVRDVMIAAVLGTSAVADAYVAAFLFPNLFRRIVSEGAFNPAFVPIFSRKKAEEGSEAAWTFAEDAFSSLLSVLMVVLIICEFAMPLIMGFIAYGFAGDSSKFALSVSFARIAFPFVITITLVALFAAILNALGRYVFASFAPVVLNLMLITALSFLIMGNVRETPAAGFTLVYTVLAAGFVQLVLMAIAAIRSGYKLRFRWPNFDTDILNLLFRALPGLLVAGSGHVHMLLAAGLSTGTAHATSWLYYADRLFQLPLGFVAASIGVVLLPSIAKSLNAKAFNEANESTSRALEFALLLTLPAAAALSILARPIVGVLYERGAFLASDTSHVAAVLRGLAIGLPGFVLIKVFLPQFFARENMRVPIIAAIIGLIVNIAMTASMMGPRVHVAAAAGVAAGAWVNALILGFELWRNQLYKLDSLAKKRVPRLVLAAILSGCFIYWLEDITHEYMRPHLSLAIKSAVLTFTCCVGIAAHIIFAHILGVIDLSGIKGFLRKAA
jgi:putative peptidoglycan lipid II flippase